MITSAIGRLAPRKLSRHLQPQGVRENKYEPLTR